MTRTLLLSWISSHRTESVNPTRHAGPRAPAMTGAARVDVWQDDGGRWRWRHRDADGGDVLRNESRPTWDQAVHTAGVAYPGVPMEVRTPAEPPERGRAGLAAALRKVVWFLLAVVAAITIGIGLLVRRIARLLGR